MKPVNFSFPGYLLLLLTLMLPAVSGFSQSKKDLREAGVTKRVEVREETETGRTRKFNESVEVYDSLGNITEEIRYNKYGDTEYHKRFVFNEKGKLLREESMTAGGKKIKEYVLFTYGKSGKEEKEEHFNGKNKCLRVVEYVYDGKIKIEKREYNCRNKLVVRKVYEHSK